MTTSGPRPTRARLLPYVGFFVAVALAGWAMALPAITGWDVHVRHFPPLHADWDPRLGVGTVPAVLIGGLALWQAIPLALRLSWGRLLVATYAAGLGWMLSLAYVDGSDGVGKILDTPYEYMRTARATTDLPHDLATFVSRIAYDGKPDTIADANWPVHIAGHPPGALVFFVVLARLGLGSGFSAGIVVTLFAASTALAVMLTLKLLGAETMARRAAPFLVFAPAAIWQCVSADAMFAAVAAWGVAALAAAAATKTVRRSIAWGLVAGLLLGYAVMLSYGLPLLGLLALAVLVVARSWRPLPWAVLGALVVLGAFTAYGYHYWSALPQLHARQYAGVAHTRPATYWWWADVAALAFSSGPLAFAGVATLWSRTPQTERQPDQTRTIRWLTGAVILVVAAADASQSSKGEVERIWLPFVPWLLIACALLPATWRRWGLAIQVVLALVIQHLLSTGW
jgi:hypothetical protein